MLAIVEFLGLVGYEVLVAYAMKAFCSMQQKKGNLPLLGVVSVGIDDDVSW